MFGLKKSKIKGNGCIIYDIPNEVDYKIAIFNSGEYIAIAVKDTNDVWYRIGDRIELIPNWLNGDGLTSYRGSNVVEQQKFVETILELFKNKT